ncbi:MAG: hypothetical protein R3F62_06405 [Planctomycetota bacterium]
MSDPYGHGTEAHDPEARPELDGEDQALEAMDRLGSAALLAGVSGLLASPAALVAGFVLGFGGGALLGGLIVLAGTLAGGFLGVVAAGLGLRARSLGAPHALSPPGSASGALWIGAVAVLFGLAGLVLGVIGVLFGLSM